MGRTYDIQLPCGCLISEDDGGGLVPCEVIGLSENPGLMEDVCNQEKLFLHNKSWSEYQRSKQLKGALMSGDNYPTVIWMGSQPIEKASKRRYRLVYRGPAREGRPDDVPFAVEQRTGMSMMKRLNWGFPTLQDGGAREAIWALSHSFGQVLMVYPKNLNPDHPIHCELNMAIIEGRESKGCDCNGPDEPEEKQS